MTDTLWLWLAVELIGLAALAPAAFLFARLPGAGLALARPLGLVLAVYPAWLLASTHVAPYGRATSYLGLIPLGLCGVLGARRLQRSRTSFRGILRRPTVRVWLVGEALFAVAFFGWALMRSYSPAVWGTEKPMDMAIVNAVNRSDSFPPHDPWLAGERLNYYYFGHYIVAFLVRITALEPTVGFNLAVALFFALAATTLFGVGSALYAAARTGGASARSPIVAGLVVTTLGLLLGNLDGGLQLLRTRDFAAYDYFSPSRIIEGTANEFPFFSFLLADLHAHVMSIPFVLLALALALQLAVAGPRLPSRNRRSWGLFAAEIFLAALAVGVLLALNPLDFPNAAILLLGSLLLWVTRGGAAERWLAGAAWIGAWVATSLLLYLAFLVSWRPATHGLGIVGSHDVFTRFAWNQVLIYGLLLWIVAAAYVHRIRLAGLPSRHLVWGAVAAVFVAVLLAPSNLAGLAVVVTGVAFAVYTAFDPGHAQPFRFLWLLLAAGTASIAVGEVVYIRDAFDGTAEYRFNTVFKFGFQAWLILAVAAGALLLWSPVLLPRLARLIWQFGVVGLVLLSLAYPVAASRSRSERAATSPTLDGLAWLAADSPGDVAAIRWLRRLPGTPTVLETVGDDFDFGGRGRISTYTGLPTVVQWPGHELQWGHDVGTRIADVRTIYSTVDLRRARALLRRYDVDYVVVGRLERTDYRRLGLRKFEALARRRAAFAGTTVYDVRPGAAQRTFSGP